MTKTETPRWAALLEEAVRRPGLILEAYSRFHGYSFGNQCAALCQCILRGIPPGPIGTVPKWNELGRSVQKGQKAIWLCMPVTVTKERDETRSGRKPATEAAEPARPRTIFVWKPRWFVLAQTDGAEFHAEIHIPTWDKATALAALGVREVPFAHPDGNVQGYARSGIVAVSPLAQLPAKTLFHELGHVLLGHVTEDAADRALLPKTLTEAEAEAVALCCLEALGLPGADYARGYIQSWYGSGQPLPEASAARIFKAADTILRAGQGKSSTSLPSIPKSAAVSAVAA